MYVLWRFCMLANWCIFSFLFFFCEQVLGAVDGIDKRKIHIKLNDIHLFVLRQFNVSFLCVLFPGTSCVFRSKTKKVSRLWKIALNRLHFFTWYKVIHQSNQIICYLCDYCTGFLLTAFSVSCYYSGIHFCWLIRCGSWSGAVMQQENRHLLHHIRWGHCLSFCCLLLHQH